MATGDPSGNDHTLGASPEPTNLAHPSLELPSSLGEGFWNRVLTLHFIYSTLGLLLGAACLAGGLLLFLRGVTGSSSWTSSVLGLRSNISDAPPGAVLFIVGILIILLTRFAVKVQRTAPRRSERGEA